MTTTTTETKTTKKLPSVYALGQEFQALDDILLETGEGATEDDATVVAQWLADLEGSFEDKLRNCIAWVREQEGAADVAEAEAKRLKRLAEVRRNAVARLKDTIREVFDAQGIKRIDTDLGAVRIVANGGKAPLLLDETINVDALPEGCKRVVVEPVKDEIRKRLEAGEQIPGARIGERGSRLAMG